MAWRLAKGLETLRSQVNAKYPGRSKDSDGSIGDEHHSARESDHNPDGAGIVHAIDITHDPKGGFDSYAFADMMLSKQDPRLKYVISNRRIGSGPAGPSAGVWRKYTGINPHDHHCHISIMSGSKADDTSSWNIDGMKAPSAEVLAAQPALPPTLRQGAKGADVNKMQTALDRSGAVIHVDGDFGAETAAVLRSFQTKAGLVADAVCGPMSWKALS